MMRRLVLTLAVLGMSALASAQTISGYRAEWGMYCAQNVYTPGVPYVPGGTITLRWPSITALGNWTEYVNFYARLVKWNATYNRWDIVGWAPGSGSFASKNTWYLGKSNRSGPIAWDYSAFRAYFLLGGQIQYGDPRWSVRPGTYAVVNYYQWQTKPGYIGEEWNTLQTSYSTGYIASGIKVCTFK